MPRSSLFRSSVWYPSVSKANGRKKAVLLFAWRTARRRRGSSSLRSAPRCAARAARSTGCSSSSAAPSHGRSERRVPRVVLRRPASLAERRVARRVDDTLARRTPTASARHGALTTQRCPGANAAGAHLSRQLCAATSVLRSRHAAPSGVAASCSRSCQYEREAPRRCPCASRRRSLNVTSSSGSASSVLADEAHPRPHRARRAPWRKATLGRPLFWTCTAAQLHAVRASGWLDAPGSARVGARGAWRAAGSCCMLFGLLPASYRQLPALWAMRAKRLRAWL